MSRLFRLNATLRRDPAVEQCLDGWTGAVGELATGHFEALRSLGEDVHEVMHDGQPTACLGEVAFAYVDVFTSHANLGFFHGHALPDPHGLLEGSGKFMRHVKLRPKEVPDVDAVRSLMQAAYQDMKARLTDS
ncbi:MAG: DUF1801 domain-containing protein [Planctomycetota bacterium]